MAKIGKYVVMGEIGRGASCVVFSTLDPDLGRQVAVKRVVKAEAQPADLERLQHEAQAGAKLSHSSIAGVYEYGEDGAAAWLAMEMVSGRSLRQHLQEGYRAALDPLAGVVVELLQGLDHAHSRGVTHGDVRAENVLVGGSGAAKLIGFAGTGDEPADVRAAAALLKECFAEAPAVLDAPPATARELLEALQGRAKDASGSRLGALRRAMKAASAAPPAPRRLPAVLFVDDEERVLNALSATFDGSYEVHTATGGAEALELLRVHRFLVICSDQRMPGMAGVELLREARALAPATVRLLLTGYSDFGAIVASVNESEVFRYITKPWQQSDLEATLAEAVEVAIAAEAAIAGNRHFEQASGKVLVFGQPVLARSVRELSGGVLGVREAYDEDSVLDIVSHESVGVVVSELHPGIEEPDALLHVLKKASPHTQLVAIAEAPDAELAIRLINEARIHRYLGKPVNLSLLQQAVTSGLQRHARLESAPGLAGTERTRRRAKSGRLRRLLARFRSIIGTGAR